jgi:hypothetical protein
MEVAVHGQLAPLIWALWQGSVSQLHVCENKGAHLMPKEQRGEEKKGLCPTVPFKGHNHNDQKMSQ